MSLISSIMSAPRRLAIAFEQMFGEPEVRTSDYSLPPSNVITPTRGIDSGVIGFDVSAINGGVCVTLCHGYEAVSAYKEAGKLPDFTGLVNFAREKLAVNPDLELVVFSGVDAKLLHDYHVHAFFVGLLRECLDAHVAADPPELLLR